MEFRIAVDCIIVGYDNQSDRLKVLLTQRINEPKRGSWALPGGFVTKTEPFEETARSILLRETGLENVYLRQLKAYSLTDSSSSNRVASIAYYSLISFDDLKVADGKQSSEWFHFKRIPDLPFDHNQKTEAAIAKIKELVRLEPVVYHLLPSKFPLNQLQRFYEELYDIEIDNRNFRKKIQKLPYIEKLDETEKNVSHRPAYLYQFNSEKYQKDLNIYGASL